MQIGLGCEQVLSSTQATQPSVGLHCRLPGHCAVPLTPQSALPDPRPLPLLPPQAITATSRAAKTPPTIPPPAAAPFVTLVLRRMR